MLPKFKLFSDKDISATLNFFKKDFVKIEQEIREVQLHHSKELERDLILEKLSKLIADVIMDRTTEGLVESVKTKPEYQTEEILVSYLKKVNKDCKRLSKILEITIKSNKLMILKLSKLHDKLVAVIDRLGKSNNGIDNMINITKNQQQWRVAVINFMEDIKKRILDITKLTKKLPKDAVQLYDDIRKVQMELYETIKDELKIQDADVNLENIDEHMDTVVKAMEEYYFNNQRNTVDTTINKRRKDIQSATKRLVDIVQSVNLIMVPLGFAALSYPRILKNFAMQEQPGMIKRRMENEQLIKASQVRIPTKKGYTLEGVYLQKPGFNKVIVILHEDIHGMFHQLLDALEYRHRYNVLIYNNTGHFGSGGHSSLGYEEAEGFTDVLEWLIQKGNTSIGVYGISIGAASAIGGIAFSKYQDYVKAAVFQAAFADRDQFINEYFEDILKIPDCKLKRMMKWLIDHKYKDRKRYRPKEFISYIKCPIMLIHDIEDPFVRFHHSLDLARTVRSPLKTYFRHGIEHYHPGNKVKRYLVINFLSAYLGE